MWKRPYLFLRDTSPTPPEPDDALYTYCRRREIHDLEPIGEARHDESPIIAPKMVPLHRRGDAAQETSRDRHKLVAISCRDGAIAT